MNKYKETENKIRDLVPRLKELSFGCEVYGDERFKERVIKVEEGNIYCDYEPQRIYEEGSFREIIGHKITLEDVLEAFCVLHPGITWVTNGLNNGAIRFIRESTVSTANQECFRWQYGKDFSLQSDECKEFIKQLTK